MNRIRIEVTQEDIDFAIQQNKGNCAIARAIKRAGWQEYTTGGGKPGFTAPKVDDEVICLTDEEYDQRFTFETPRQAAKFVGDFDKDRTSVKPFGFTLDYDRALKVRPKKHLKPTEYIDKARTVEAAHRREVARQAGVPLNYRPIR